jgi:hypothetical protein
MSFKTLAVRLAVLSTLLLAAACVAPTVQVTPTAVPASEATAEPTGEPAGEATTAPVAEADAAPTCPPVSGEAQLFADETSGFCFHVPAGFTATRHALGSSLIVFAPETTPGHRERAFVDVELAVSRTAETAADAVIDALPPGFTITRSAATLGSLPAVVVEGLPGQDIQRKLFAVADDRLFTFTFVPVALSQPDEASAEMEALYASILTSFTALPPAASLAWVEQPILVWQGDVQGACHTLQIGASGEAAAGLCGDAAGATMTFGPDNTEWDAVRTHFGPIDAHAYLGRVIFAGSGDATGPLWGEALAAWASFTAQEMIAGRTSAAGRTVVAWQLDELADRPGQCRHLIGLAYGYAYANVIPCGGGQAEQLAAGWLTEDELATLITWSLENSRVDDPAGYVDTLGTAPLEATTVAEWAAAVYDRLAAQ